MSLNPIKIVVATSGWVFIGHTTNNTDGSLTMENAKVIRRWGTTSGLGQLASQGKQRNTVLDETGTIHVAASAVIATINVDQKKWKM